MKIKIDQYRIFEKKQEYNVLLFPDYPYAWAYDDFPEEGLYEKSQYKADGDKEFYSALMHALAILIADPSKIICFPIKKKRPYIRPSYENYHLVMARPELQFKRSRWFDIKGRLDRKHWVGKYTFNYNEKKLRDYCEKYKASDLFWKKPWRPERRKDYVEQLIGDTVFQILSQEVCYYYFDYAIDLLNDTWNGNSNIYNDEYSEFAGLGWILPDRIAEKYREEATV